MPYRTPLELLDTLDQSSVFNRLRKALKSVPEHWKDGSATTAVVLGSGWNQLMNSKRIQRLDALAFSDVSGLRLPVKGSGHNGRFLLCEIDGRRFLIQDGRLHFYDVQNLTESLTPLWLMINSGVRNLVLTNASGGVNQHYEVGHLVGIEDHIPFGIDPLFGVPQGMFSELLFNPMNGIYTPALLDRFEALVPVPQRAEQRAVYTMFSGPSYETPATIRAMRAMGIDLVGMSIMHEAACAHAAGLQVAGISCVSNPAADASKPAPNHEEVKDAVGQAMARSEDHFLDFLVAVAEM